MSNSRIRLRFWHAQEWLLGLLPRGRIPAMPLTIVLACAIGVLGGYGAALFTMLIRTVSSWSIAPLRDFGTRDVETLPVELREGKKRRLVGLLLRADVMRRYRDELLRKV